MHKNTISVGIISLLIGSVAGYAGAGLFARPVVTPQNTRSGFSADSSLKRGGGNFLSGTVAKEDSGSMTLNTRDGNSRVVFITPDTAVSKSVSGTLGDVSIGSTVIVSGTTNSDGSVSAALIQIRPTTPSPATTAQ